MNTLKDFIMASNRPLISKIKNKQWTRWTGDTLPQSTMDYLNQKMYSDQGTAVGIKIQFGIEVSL